MIKNQKLIVTENIILFDLRVLINFNDFLLYRILIKSIVVYLYSLLTKYYIRETFLKVQSITTNNLYTKCRMKLNLLSYK